jgi:hypothetical protein
MSSRWELDDGIKSIKSAWQREHTARANLEKMLENAEDENAKLRELLDYMTPIAWYVASERERDRMRELGVEVDG